MPNREKRRAHILQLLSDALQEDDRLAGLVLIGSGATGFNDDESDIDLLAPVLPGYDAAAVFEEWRGRLQGLIGARYLADTAATEQMNLLVAHCDYLLEVDLSFPPLRELAALSPRWLVLWERTGEVERRLTLPAPAGDVPAHQAYAWTLNRGVHRATYAARALRRSDVWKAMLQLDELRHFALQLASLDLFNDQDIYAHTDALPEDLTRAFGATLPASPDVESVRAALGACVDLMLNHAAALDLRYGVERSEPVRALLAEHLSEQGTLNGFSNGMAAG